MKVGTDGVLLGAWADPGNAARILDIGTGTGLLALMMAQRSSATIDAIEVDENAVEQARENVLDSPWADRITVHYCSLQDYNPAVKYGLILSNPPFYSGLQSSPDYHRSVARQGMDLDLGQLFERTSKLLDNDGRICLILPSEQEESVAKIINDLGLHCNRRMIIQSNPGKSPIRIMLSVERSAGSIQNEILSIELDQRHHYSPEYIRLTKDFYLDF